MSNILNNTTSLQEVLEALQNKAIPGGTDTNDATATADEIFAGETAYTADGKVTGTFTIENEITTQEELIAELSAILDNKTAGSGVELPTLTNPASENEILSGYEAIDGNGNIITGVLEQQSGGNEFPYTVTVNNNLGMSYSIFYDNVNIQVIVVGPYTLGAGSITVTGGQLEEVVGNNYAYYYISSITDNVILTITYSTGPQ